MPDVHFRRFDRACRTGRACRSARAPRPGRPGCASRCCISSCSARCCSRVDHAHRRPYRRSAHHRRRRRRSTTRHATLFKASRGREPNADELHALRRVWLDNEVLYREGLALQVDQGDTAIRERVIFKALSVVDAGRQAAGRRRQRAARLVREQPRQATTSRRATTSRKRCWSGDTSEAAVRGFVAALNTRHARRRRGRPARVQGPAAHEPGAELRRRVRAGARGDRRRANGARCARETAGARCGSTRSRRPEPADFEALRGVVLQDWTDAMMAEQRTAAVRALGKKYTRDVRDGGGADERPAASLAAAGRCWRCVAGAAAGARDEHGRDGAARDLARRIPVAVDGDATAPPART